MAVTTSSVLGFPSFRYLREKRVQLGTTARWFIRVKIEKFLARDHTEQCALSSRRPAVSPLTHPYQPSPIASPLLILEIFEQVSEYFSAAEATAPARVCRLWNGVFAAIVWREFKVSCHGIHDSMHLGIEKNSRHIRDFTSVSMGRFPVPCTRLTSIKFDGSHFEPSGRGAAVDEFPLQLVRQNPQLHTLYIKAEELGPPAELWSSCHI